MKWALVFVFFETGIYETGLTFRTFAECQKAADEIHLAAEDREVEGAWLSTGEVVGNSRYNGRPVMQCLPTK